MTISRAPRCTQRSKAAASDGSANSMCAGSTILYPLCCWNIAATSSSMSLLCLRREP